MLSLRTWVRLLLLKSVVAQTVDTSKSHIFTNSSTGVIPASNGSPEQCAHSIAIWLDSSSSWSFAHNVTSIAIKTQTQPAWTTAVLPYCDATSLTTLCDGHPRVVGYAPSTSTTTILGNSGPYTTSTYPITHNTYDVPPYPISTAPCAIQEDDCEALYNKNATLVYVSGSPICNFSSTARLMTSYATQSDGQICSLCYIRASSARLLYWPIRTISGSQNMCGSKSPQTVGLPRTGDGPNTFVTEGITITSPSVAISLASVSRVDGCFTTLRSTVVVVAASEVMSARGARALYDHEPFAYQDLNYKCQSAKSSKFLIQDGPGDDCYQEVPAIAYFSGESAFVWDEYYPTAYGPPLTIGPDYRPYIMPPTSLTGWANDIFSTTSCQIQVNGIWDPPRALVPGTAVLLPVPAWQTTTSTATSTVAPAVPAEQDNTQPIDTSMQTSTKASQERIDNTQPVATSTPRLTRVSTPEVRSILTIVFGNQGPVTVLEDADDFVVVDGETTLSYPGSVSTQITFDSDIIHLGSESVYPSDTGSGQTSAGTTANTPYSAAFSTAAESSATTEGQQADSPRRSSLPSGTSTTPSSSGAQAAKSSAPILHTAGQSESVMVHPRMIVVALLINLMFWY